MLDLVTVNLNPESEKFNPRQRLFFDTVMKSVSDFQQHQIYQEKLSALSPDDEEYLPTLCRFEELELALETRYKRFHYGGGIRGGKTIITLTIIIMMCKIFPKSKWHVVRKSFPVLTGNAVKSVEDILKHSENVRWKRSPAEYYCQFSNGSRIYFITESYQQDNQLTKFLGLETNGFLFEQLEEINEKAYPIICSRAGSFYGVDGPMPPGLILTTFNPTYSWVKKEIYDADKRGELASDEFFCEALPSDNPYVTKDQWDSWAKLDPDSYNRFIKGVWDIPIENQFFNYFSEEKNVSKEPLELDLTEHIVLSFDFNVEPMTCTMQQSDGHSYMRVIKEFRAMPSDTYALCDLIRPIIYGMEHLILITGDASGSNRISGARNHINHYEIVKAELGLKNEQFRVPSANPFISDSRVFMNSLFYRLPEFLIDSSCEYLIQDLKFLEVAIDNDGKVEIQKTGINKSLQIDNKLLGHMSDTLRYGCHSMLPDWLKLPKS